MPLSQDAVPIEKSPALLVGVSLMAASWVADSALDAYFEQVPLPQEIFHPTMHELCIRILFMVFQLAFILYIGRILSQYHGKERELEQALQQTEQEKMRSQEYLEAVGDAISIQDTQLRILYQNQAHKEMMGDKQGCYCYHAYHGKDAICEGCHLALSFADGLSHRREAQKGERYFEIISTPLRDPSGKIVAGIEAVRDITERKAVELHISSLNRELELRARRLSEVNGELEAFNYSLSHDLRSYITRISTVHQILEEMVFGDGDAEFLLKTLGDSCVGMEELIESMLTLSHVSRREMELEVVPISDMVAEVAFQMQQQEPLRQVDLVVAPGLTAWADRHLLKVALENLIGNAWKYTRDAAAPQIAFGRERRDGRDYFFIRDNGVGFSMVESDRLFTPFQRLQSSRGFRGTGVGLATVQRVLLRHGGEISGEGELGGGATFRFWLPEAEPAAGA